MNKEELNEIIEQLELVNSKDEAFFGIFQYGGGSDESFVKANKQGLELFAVELLKSSRDANEVFLDEEKSIISLDSNENWLGGDTFIDYIELMSDIYGNNAKQKDKVTWKDQTVKIGCFTIVVVLLISLVVGLITMGKWFF